MVKVRKTCHEMLRDRGCTSVLPSNDGAVLMGYGPPNIHVHFHMEERVGVKHVRQIMDECPEDTDIIIVSPEGATSFTKKEYEGQRVQFLLMKDLCYNVTKHSLVPKHEKVVSAPVSKEYLPKILDSDIQVQYHGWRIGTIVKITRAFGGSEPITYFRVVSPDV